MLLGEQTPLMGAAREEALESDELRRRRAGIHPTDSYSPISRLFLAWNIPLVATGNREVLERTLLPDNRAKHRAKAVGARILAEWDGEQQRSRERGRPPSLIWAVLRMLRADLAFGYLIAIVHGILTTVARPLILRMLINYVAGADEGDVDFDYALALVAALACTALFEGWLGVLYRHLLADDLGTTFLTAMYAVLMDKIVRSVVVPQPPATDDQPSKEGSTATAAAGGEDVTTLVGNDVMRRFRDFLVSSNLPSALAAFVGGVATLVYVISPIPAVTGVVVMLAVMLANFKLAAVAGRQEHRNLEMASARIGILGEILSGTKLMKFFAWESPYLNKISAARDRECVGIRRFRMLQVISIGLGRATPALASCAAITAFALMSDDLNAGDVFAAISVFQSLRLSLIVFPHAITCLATIRTSLRRIQAYLLVPGHPGRIIAPESGPAARLCNAACGFPEAADEKAASSAAAVRLLEATGVISNAEAADLAGRVQGGRIVPVLREINLCVSSGQIVAVVGNVGSGKSALLQSVVGELALGSGTVEAAADIGYVPQRAAIVSGTVLENIIFGRPLDRRRLDEVIVQADLGKDLELLSDGLHSEIGERGTTLSGGQQQRISIARALYARPRLLVLDDPLSAVDPEVCARIFERAIKAHAHSGGAVLMACNQMHLLQHCDSVVYLSGGKVAESGGYAALVNAGGTFSQLIRSHVIEEATEGDADNPGVSHHTAAAGAQLPREAPGAQEPAKSAAGPRRNDQTGVFKREAMASGAMRRGLISGYFRAMGIPLVLGVGASIALGYACMAFMDVFLTMWIRASDDAERDGDPFDRATSLSYAGIYIAASLGFTFFVLLGSTGYCFGGYSASKALHHRVVSKLLYAPYAWFQDTPVGRTTSRLTTDLSLVDLELSFWCDNGSQLGMQFLAMVSVIVYFMPLVGIVIAVAGAIYAYASSCVNKANREVKREANAAMAPVQSNMSEAVHCRSVARAMSCSHFFINRNYELTDALNRSNYVTYSIMSWMQLFGSFIASFVSITTGVLVITVYVDVLEPGEAGLVLSYSFLLPYFLSFIAMIITTLRAYFTALERIQEYENLPQEPPHCLPGDEALTAWPSEGVIAFDNAGLRYAPQMPPALRDITIRIPARARVGVVGRTGAGKSSLMSLVFRLVDSTQGKVLIDGVDTQKVGLRKLRKSISIVPQEPILMNGTVRYNLDPFNEKSEVELERALRMAYLDPELLDLDINGGGDSLSAGQQQLLCFARALLHRAPVVIMDEPTANCDMETDDQIQAMVRREFADATVLTIAHRINTVIDSDLIIVMGAGAVLEFGPPAELLDRRGGELARMVDSMGPETARSLRAKAAVKT